MLSQKVALAWAMPTSPMPSRWASSSPTPASSLMISLMISAQLRVDASSRSRTAGSLRRSDSKTRRKAWPVLSTKSKKAVKVAVTRCLLSVLEASALRTVAASASTLSSSRAR